ncbi:MAG: hypothetical protein AAGA58_04675 [Verrucomicrobiota bacterium]
MRTTVDIPDALFNRVKRKLYSRKVTFRAAVITALERFIDDERPPFVLREAAVGDAGAKPVTTERINAAIDDLAEPRFG